jgi:hypothetical protein
MPYETLSALDRPHRLAASGIWEVPVGRGRHFGAGMHRALDFAIGGWQIGGIVIKQSGPPLGFGNVIFNGDPDAIRLPGSQRDVDRWFNVDAGFNRVAQQQLASNIRTFPLRFSGLRGDGQDSWDFSIVKNFAISEEVRAQFRARCI